MNTNIAFFSTSLDFPFSSVQRMAAVIDIQTQRDFLPLWGRGGKTIAVTSKNAVPTGYCPAAIMNDIGEPGALGFHTDENQQPLIFIDVNDQTEVTGGHEALETRVDPQGSRLVPVTLRGETVLMLIEVSDPNEAETYEINGVKCTNFYKPEFLDSVVTPNFKYDFLGNNTSPLYVNKGGYISYMKNGQWYQDTFFDDGGVVTRGPLNMVKSYPHQSLRSMVDQFMMAHNWDTTV